MSPMSAMPSPSIMPGGARRISARATWPQITATSAPMNGMATQQTMPKTRLTMAVVLVVRTGMFMAATRVGDVILELELDALRKRQRIGVVDRVRLAAHVGLPGVGARLAAAAGFLLAAERTADLGAARADVDVRDAAIGTRARQECLGRFHVQGEDGRGQALRHAVVHRDGLVERLERHHVE